MMALKSLNQTQVSCWINDDDDAAAYRVSGVRKSIRIYLLGLLGSFWLSIIYLSTPPSRWGQLRTDGTA